MRGSTEEAMQREFIARGVIVKANDSPKMQEADVRILHNEVHTGIERAQTYAFTSVPLPISSDGSGAEVVVAFPQGDRSQGVVVATDDRRHRPKNLKPGESAHHDDQGQYSKLTRDGHVAVAKEHSITAGDQPETGSHELNEQLKGLGARLAQAENHVHALFDVTSRLRQLTQVRVPEVAALASILNQDASGLDAMVASVSTAATQAYLQKAVQSALAKFLAPNIAGLASVLAGGIEAAITSLQGELASLLAANPVVAAVDALQAELAALTGSGAAPNVIASGTARLQSQIDALTAANPVLATSADMRSQLSALISSAGPGLNFLAPQQRLVQGLSKSLRLGSA